MGMCGEGVGLCVCSAWGMCVREGMRMACMRGGVVCGMVWRCGKVSVCESVGVWWSGCDGYGYDVMCRGGCVVGDVCGRAGGSCVTGCVACVVCAAWCLHDWTCWLGVWLDVVG